MGDHVLRISVGDGGKIPEGALLTQIIAGSKSWHFDGQLFEFCLGEVVSSLYVLYLILISVCVLLCSVDVLGGCPSYWRI